ncbi:MAG TPA: mechanosensitive ion channel, partial [Candidatus Absconditabacterales bacterium]|nr:mechanosensitive ion channel [Candidatus Absconditabacterales bacterium]
NLKITENLNILIMISKAIASIIRKKVIESSILENKKSSDKIGDLISDVVFYSLVIFCIFIGFELLGFDVSLLLGGISFGIGLAFKEILGNMIAGIMILSTKEIKLGDIIEVQTDGGVFGRIEEITIRYTTIRTLDLRQVIIPNTTLITVPIKTYSAEETVKVKTKIRIHYDSDLKKAEKAIVDGLNSLEFTVDKDKTKAVLTEYGDSEIIMTGIFFFNPNAGLLLEYAVGEANHRVRDYLEQNGIVIPYPHVTVTVDHNDTDLLGTMVYASKTLHKQSPGTTH